MTGARGPRFRLGLLLWLAGMLGVAIITFTMLPRLLQEASLPAPALGDFTGEPRAERVPRWACGRGGRRARAASRASSARVRSRRRRGSARVRAQAAARARSRRWRSRRDVAHRRVSLCASCGRQGAGAIPASSPRPYPLRRYHRGAALAFAVHDAAGVAGVAIPATPGGCSTDCLRLARDPREHLIWCRVTCRPRFGAGRQAFDFHIMLLIIKRKPRIRRIFGYLFWRHGLEAAMIAHGTAHAVNYIAGRL